MISGLRRCHTHTYIIGLWKAAAVFMIGVGRAVTHATARGSQPISQGHLNALEQQRREPTLVQLLTQGRQVTGSQLTV